MKKILLFGCIIASMNFFNSCKNSGNETPESGKTGSILALINEDAIKSILDSLKNDGILEENQYKALQSRVKNYNIGLKEKSIKQNQGNDTTIIKINSLELFKNIYQDRSLNLKQYLGKKIIITDILLENVKTNDVGGDYIKYAYGIPFDPKTNTIGRAKKGEYDSDYQTNFISYKGNFLNYDETPDLAKDDASIEIKLNSPDEMKKINLLTWESNDSLDYNHKIDIKCIISNIDYNGGYDKKDDIKSKKIKISVDEGEIFTGK